MSIEHVHALRSKWKLANRTNVYLNFCTNSAKQSEHQNTLNKRLPLIKSIALRIGSYIERRQWDWLWYLNSFASFFIHLRVHRWTLQTWQRIFDLNIKWAINMSCLFNFFFCIFFLSFFWEIRMSVNQKFD